MRPLMSKTRLRKSAPFLIEQLTHFEDDNLIAGWIVGSVVLRNSATCAAVAGGA
jgi:hypothetical protein